VNEMGFDPSRKKYEKPTTISGKVPPRPGRRESGAGRVPEGTRVSGNRPAGAAKTGGSRVPARATKGKAR
jgi:hypothetical protein